MNKCKKIEKELLFKNNIKDITSISLDVDYRVNDNEISGNFLVMGDYKIHEISLNREKFNFKIPFKEMIENDIDKDSVKVDIVNFLYDFKKDELLVNIEYEIVGDRKDILIFDDEKSLDEFLENKEVEIIDTRMEEIKEEIENIDENTIEEERTDEVVNQEDINISKEENYTINISEERKVEEVKQEEILNNINKHSDKFVTYKIYKIEENDTLESIVLKYKTTIDDLKEYNDLSNIQISDKIIIPYYE